MPTPMLEQHIDGLKKKLTEARGESQNLALDVQYFNEFDFKQKRLQEQVDEVNDRIRALDIENRGGANNRVVIQQEGQMPGEPTNDSRHKRALAGAMAGFGMSFGVFFLWGAIDRRAYGARQLSRTGAITSTNMLGVLPDLSSSFVNAESTDVAAHCVHQIRNQIEALRDPRAAYVLAVSSPHQGDGKTSIVMALGWSYAAAGYKTIVVDCDLVGRSLTRQLGLIGREGLREVLLAHSVNGEVTTLGVPHLSALPVGIDSRFGPEAVRRPDLDYLFGELRKDFEIIIVDTGPMLGSLESTPVVATADGVVLSVRRGRSRSRLDECVAKVDALGGTCIGVVLNYAVRSDCNRYVSEASLAASEERRQYPINAAATQTSVVRVSDEDRNALISAMESAARARHADAPED
jgi:Mrp family chromosome partitioning ATPase